MSDSDKVLKQILDGTAAAKKLYHFNDEHDPDLPTRYWFQNSQEGMVLFVVFYTQACRWSRCISCSLPSTCASQPVHYKHQINQVYWLMKQPDVKERADRIRKVIISNNGSVLDEATFSSNVLMYLTLHINRYLPHVNRLSIETRPEYVDPCELEFLARALREWENDAQLEIAVGVEVFDDRIRNDVLLKGLQMPVLERLVERMNPYAYRLKCYLMQKPVPGMTGDEAIADIHNAIDYLSGLAKRYDKVPINIHLNPTYVARGTILEHAFARGEYAPPTLLDTVKAALHAEGKPISIFVGLDDEGLAVPGGSFRRAGDEALAEALETFNTRQDFNVLKEALQK